MPRIYLEVPRLSKAFLSLSTTFLTPVVGHFTFISIRQLHEFDTI
jgi:hypothetical protein